MADHGVMTKNMNMLCWGGPEHGKVVAVPSHINDVYLFPVQRRATYKITEQVSPIAHAIGTVRYDVERIAFGRDEWKVLVYPENKQGHQDRLVAVMNGLARLCTWEWALRQADE